MPYEIKGRGVFYFDHKISGQFRDLMSSFCNRISHVSRLRTVVEHRGKLYGPRRFQFCGNVIIKRIKSGNQDDGVTAVCGNMPCCVRNACFKGKTGAFGQGKFATGKGGKNTALGISGRS